MPYTYDSRWQPGYDPGPCYTPCHRCGRRTPADELDGDGFCWSADCQEAADADQAPLDPAYIAERSAARALALDALRHYLAWPWSGQRYGAAAAALQAWWRTLDRQRWVDADRRRCEDDPAQARHEAAIEEAFALLDEDDPRAADVDLRCAVAAVA